MTIQSNLSSASNIATGITNSSASISGVATGAKDTVSNYQGNSDASTHISREGTYNSQVAATLSQFVNLIHSTASEFEAIDQSLSKSITSSLQLPASPMDTIASSKGPLPYTGSSQRLMVE